MQVAIPVPREAADTGAHKGSDTENRAKAEKRNADSTLAVKEKPGTEPRQNARATEGAQNKEYSVAAGKLTPVSTHRDWVDYSTLGVSFAVCIAAFFAARYALKTLKAIERQVELMDKQATTLKDQTTILDRSVKVAEENTAAAKAGADAVVNSERAWVLIEFVLKAPVEVAGGMATMFFSVKCTNSGKSPAWITSWRLGFINAIKLPSSPPAEEMRLEVPSACAIGPGGHIHIDDHLHASVDNPPDGIAVVYGYLDYLDIFGRERETRIAYRIFNRDGSYQALTQLTITGWNQAT